ncbi:MAG: hypothetical protein HQK76_02350 [Desulfobacterales bacterium]|nr:hypothetical protein [Desulfobacterales bacterium]
MEAQKPSIYNPISIGGIKFNQKVIVANFLIPNHLKGLELNFFDFFAKNKINIQFLSMISLDFNSSIYCCFKANEVEIDQLLNSDLSQYLNIIYDKSVITLFPHKLSFGVIGTVFNALSKIPIFSLNSSISGLSLVIDFGLKDYAFSICQKSFTLPAGCSPSPPIEPMETIAVYWEPVIKTYGFNENRNLFSFEINFNKKDFNLIKLADWFMELNNIGLKFEFLIGNENEQKNFCFLILMEKQTEKKFWELIEQKKNSINANLEIKTSLADLLFFHGPHFGDRHGIASTAVKAINEYSIPIKSMGCSGASIYIALPPNNIDNAKKALSKYFKSP